MAGDLNTRKITILLDESLIDELTGWVSVNNGEIVRVEKPRKKKSTPVSEENEAADKTPATCVELQRKVVRLEIDIRQTQNPHE